MRWQNDVKHTYCSSIGHKFKPKHRHDQEAHKPSGTIALGVINIPDLCKHLHTCTYTHT